MSSLPVITPTIDAIGGSFLTRLASERAAWQWQPVTVGTSATHDPSPPITIDTFVPPAVSLISRTLMGVGL